jgi:hypothetical protein
MSGERSEDERAKLLEGAVKRGTEAALEEYERRLSGGDVKIGWMGFKLEGKGRAVVSVVLALVVIGRSSWRAGTRTIRKRRSVRCQQTHEHAQIDERLNEMIYVLTLSSEEKERLNLQMPDSLRRKQLERNLRP